MRVQAGDVRTHWALQRGIPSVSFGSVGSSRFTWPPTHVLAVRTPPDSINAQMSREAKEVRLREGADATPVEPGGAVEIVRYRPEDEISLAWLASVVLKHRYVVLLSMVLVAALGVAHLVLTFSPTYTAVASFMPEGGTRSGASGLQTVASRFGLEMPLVGGGTASPTFYANLLDSREILTPLVLDTFTVERGIEDQGRGARRGILLDFLELGDLPQPVAVQRGVEWLRGVTDPTVTPSTGVVSLTVTTPWPELSEDLARGLLERLNAFNLERLQSQAAAERRFVEDRLAEVQEDVRLIEEELKDFLQSNREFQNSPELRFQHDRLQRQVAMRQQLFTSLSQSYEQARINEVRNTPVITVLEQPVEPVDRNPRGLKQRGLLGLALGLALGVVYAFGRDYAGRAPSERSEQRELKRVAREAIEDVRRFFRRIRGLFSRG